MYTKILVPLDRSENAESVLPLACTIARNSHADITLLHIVEYPFSVFPVCEIYPPTDPALLDLIQENKKIILQGGKEYLEDISTRLDQAGAHVSLAVREGPVVETIISTAEELLADLIVISAHGRSGSAHGMIGSVADRVLREAAMPVILVRPDLSVPLPEAFLRQSVVAAT